MPCAQHSHQRLLPVPCGRYGTEAGTGGGGAERAGGDPVWMSLLLAATADTAGSCGSPRCMYALQGSLSSCATRSWKRVTWKLPSRTRRSSACGLARLRAAGGRARTVPRSRRGRPHQATAVRDGPHFVAGHQPFGAALFDPPRHPLGDACQRLTRELAPFLVRSMWATRDRLGAGAGGRGGGSWRWARTGEFRRQQPLKPRRHPGKEAIAGRRHRHRGVKKAVHELI